MTLSDLDSYYSLWTFAGNSVKHLKDKWQRSAKMWVEEMYILQVCIPLCCKLDADLGSEGGGHLLGQEEVGEVLILGGTRFPEMKSRQQQEEEEEENDLFCQKIIYFYNI